MDHPSNTSMAAQRRAEADQKLSDRPFDLATVHYIIHNRGTTAAAALIVEMHRREVDALKQALREAVRDAMEA